MWNFIRLMIGLFNNPTTFFMKILKNPRSSLYKLLAKNIDPKILNLIVADKNIARLLDPNVLWKAFQRATTREITDLMKDIKSLNKDEREQALSLLRETDTRPKFLSSSWVKMGQFIQTRGSTSGILVIWVKSDHAKNQKWYGPYMYPHVQLTTWQKMRAATGKNGSRINPIGAGSIMWHDFLDLWLPSQLRQYILENRDKMKPQTYQENLDFLKRNRNSFANLYKRNETSSPHFASKRWEQSPQPILDKQGRPTFDYQGNQRFTFNRNSQQAFRESRVFAAQRQMDRVSYRGQRNATIGRYRANYQRDIMSVQTPYYRVMEAIKDFNKAKVKARHSVNIRRQALNQIRKVTK